MGRRKPKEDSKRSLKKAVIRVPIELGTMKPSFRPEETKGNFIIQIFWNVDLRCNHTGLSKVAQDFGDVDVTDLLPGEMCIFVNAAKNKMKLLVGCTEKDSQGIMAYYKTPHNRRIDVQALEYIPESFSAKRGVAYSEALKKSLEERLNKKRPTRRTGATLEPRHFAKQQPPAENKPETPAA